MEKNNPDNLNQNTVISKTRIKQEMHSLQRIGARLTELNSKQLEEFHLPQILLEAIFEAKKISKYGARRRQIQFIGRLMREVDINPIKKKLLIWDGLSNQHTAWLHQIEYWRNSLLKDKSAFSEFAQQYPDANLQRIRTLTRNIKREMFSGKPLRSFKTLFQELQLSIPKTTKQNDLPKE